MGKKHLDELWHEAVIKAVDVYKQPVSGERHKALLSIWHRCIHGIIIADEGCSCQEGHLEKCSFLNKSETVAKAFAGHKFSFENFCQAIQTAIAAARAYQSPTEEEQAAGEKIVAGVKVAKIHEAVVAHMSHTKIDAQRQAVAVVWQSFVHKSALALGMCGCQRGEFKEYLARMDIKTVKEMAAGRGQGFETFFDEVKKMAEDEEVKLLRVNPALLKKA